MKRFFLANVVFFTLAVLTVRCTDPFWGGKFSCSVYIINNTDGDIFAEYEDVEQDTIYTQVVSPSTSQNRQDIGFNLGEFQGDKKDKWPPEEFVSERMSHLTVYRIAGDIKQYLPRTCYDESSDFDRGADYEFDVHYVKYGLIISENMFSE